jgi:putative DNA primase/helicase
MAEQVFRSIAGFDVAQPLRFRFTADAQQLFIEWLTELERTVRDNNLHPALISHLSKYRSLMPSLALLFELADGGSGTVSLAHAQQAADWCGYLESHARRVYSMIIARERQAAQELGRHLETGWKRQEGRFTVRDVERNNWSGLTTPDDVRHAAELLEDAGWIRRSEIERTKGRPSELFEITRSLPGGRNERHALAFMDAQSLNNRKKPQHRNAKNAKNRFWHFWHVAPGPFSKLRGRWGQRFRNRKTHHHRTSKNRKR